jgi:hypothetical protein
MVGFGTFFVKIISPHKMIIIKVVRKLIVEQSEEEWK